MKMTMEDIRVLRKYAGIKQNKVAEAIGVNIGNYCQMELGNMNSDQRNFEVKNAYEYIFPKVRAQLLNDRRRVRRIEKIIKKIK